MNNDARRVTESAGAPVPVSTGGERRRFGRLHCQEISSSLGIVCDLSAGGLRVMARRKPWLGEGAPYTCTLHTPLGTFSVPTHIMRIRKQGFACFEIGLRFGELSADIRQTLSLLARSMAQPPHRPR